MKNTCGNRNTGWNGGWGGTMDRHYSVVFFSTFSTLLYYYYSHSSSSTIISFCVMYKAQYNNRHDRAGRDESKAGTKQHRAGRGGGLLDMQKVTNISRMLLLIMAMVKPLAVHQSRTPNQHTSVLWSLNGTLGNGPVLRYPCSRVPAVIAIKSNDIVVFTAILLAPSNLNTDSMAPAKLPFRRLCCPPNSGRQSQLIEGIVDF